MAALSDGPPPATAAWREGDPPGDRLFADLGAFVLEGGGALPSVRVAYEEWGVRDADGANSVLVLHALTGDAHVVGPAGPGQRTAGWWDGLIGPGAPIDTDRWHVVAPNVLGGCGGTTGPSSPGPDGSPWGSRFPQITVRDQVAVEVSFADLLGIDRWAAVIGGSMGGMRALEWLVGQPERVAAGLVLAVGGEATADQIGTQAAQVLAIRSDPRWRGGDYHDSAPGEGPHAGLGLARRIAHLTYRTEYVLDVRFGREPQGAEDPLRGGRFAVQSYLDHHADKLARRFDAGTYITLTEAMSTHDVGRGRGGLAAALGQITAPVVVAGVDTDRLYPLRQQEQLAEQIPTAVGGCRVIASPYGHDGFLLETDAVSALVAEVLDLAGVEIELARDADQAESAQAS